MELKISPKFTIEDIHKIREFNYEITKNMTLQEKVKWYNESANKVQSEIELMRQNK